jgi:hypothetical protein
MVSRTSCKIFTWGITGTNDELLRERYWTWSSKARTDCYSYWYFFSNENSVLCNWYLVNHILQHNLLLFILCPIQELNGKSQLTYSEILKFISTSRPVVFHVSIFGIIEWWLIFIELDAVCTAVNDTDISNFLSKKRLFHAKWPSHVVCSVSWLSSIISGPIAFW